MPEHTGLFETKSDFAYRMVSDRILSGELEPGTVIQQRDLARELGISTTPLREAMRRLMTEGLVWLDSHRDARVTPLRAEEARDLVEVRRSLDPLAASLAAQRRTTDDIEAIRAAAANLAPLSAKPDVDALIAHRRFHAAIYRASHNELLIESLETLWNKADRYRRFALADEPEPQARERTAREHRLLAEAVIDRDSEAAAAVMRAHIDGSHGAAAAQRLGEDGDASGRDAAMRAAMGAQRGALRDAHSGSGGGAGAATPTAGGGAA